jgi:hypothetical protein
MAINGISPWLKTSYKTQLAPLWTISLITNSGVIVNLTGLDDSALSIYFKDISTGVETQGVGTLHIVQSSPAIVSYQVNASDVVIGNYDVRLWVTFGNGPDFFDLGTWSVES